MRILLINNDGAGFADHIEVADGTSISQLLVDKLPYAAPRDHLIRVNRQTVSSDYLLQAGDRVSITPTKVHGAD